MNAQSLCDWVPIVVSYQTPQPSVDWCFLDGQRFIEPFFEDTISQRFTDPFSLLFRQRTTLEELVELQRTQPGLPPNGLIFHVSRCGSTLISRLFAALPQTVVLSEAGPLDAMFRAGDFLPALSRETHIAYIRAMVSALGQKRHESERSLLIKLDCWNMLDFSLIREAFPDVPWVVVTREPVEVLASHHKGMGAQMVPGMLSAHLLGMTPEEIAQMPIDEYGARLLGSIYREAAVQAEAAGGLILDYRDLPEAIWTRLPAYFGIDCDADDLATMQDAAQYHAKTPHQTFQSDTAQKQSIVSERMLQLAEAWMNPSYRKLEALSLQQNGSV